MKKKNRIYNEDLIKDEHYIKSCLNKKRIKDFGKAIRREKHFRDYLG